MKAPPDRPHPKFPYLFIALLWACSTAINIYKPFHIDDTFHLEAAQWIAQHPLRPMSGMINWTDIPEPIHHFNQPPVYNYLVAMTGTVFGFSEIPLHLAQSLFTLIAIVFFFRISLIVSPKHARFITAIFAFCPAFIVNQNLMTDVPLLSMSLVFIYLLIRPERTTRWQSYSLAAFILGLAILTKYTLLPMLVVLAASVYWRKNYRQFALLLIPLGMIGLWSWWNVAEFGQIHILGRERDSFDFTDIGATSLSFMACIGAVAPFTLALFSGLFRRQQVLAAAIHAIFALVVALAAITWFSLIPADLSKEILRYLFLLNGMLLIVTVLILTFLRFSNRTVTAPFGHTGIVLFLWFAGISAFLIRYSPFIATRHILLVVPPVLLLGSWVLDRVPRVLKVQAMTATVLLGVFLGVSDWLYADFYRKGAEAANIIPAAGEKVWTAGHWGWQWYSEREGMIPYDTLTARPRAGDWLVKPTDIAIQKMNPGIAMVPVRKFWQRPGPLTFLSTAYYAGFYMSSYRHPAWRFSGQPADTITIFRIINK